PRAAREHTEIQRLEMREALVRSLDREDRVPRFVLIAFVERVHSERAPVVGAKLENGDRLVDTAEESGRLAADLHEHAGRMAVRAQHLARALEVFVGVETLPDFVDRQTEQSRVETLTAARHRAGRGKREAGSGL